jgi:hypothetical protein
MGEDQLTCSLHFLDFSSQNLFEGHSQSPPPGHCSVHLPSSQPPSMHCRCSLHGSPRGRCGSAHNSFVLAAEGLAYRLQPPVRCDAGYANQAASTQLVL